MNMSNVIKAWNFFSLKMQLHARFEKKMELSLEIYYVLIVPKIARITTRKNPKPFYSHSQYIF